MYTICVPFGWQRPSTQNTHIHTHTPEDQIKHLHLKDTGGGMQLPPRRAFVFLTSEFWKYVFIKPTFSNIAAYTIKELHLVIFRARFPLFTCRYELCTYMNLARVLVGGWLSDAPHFSERICFPFELEFLRHKILLVHFYPDTFLSR